MSSADHYAYISGAIRCLEFKIVDDTDIERTIDAPDLIEAFNARSVKEKNKKAYLLSMEFKKPITAGSDAHLGFEIGSGRTIVNGDLEVALKKGETELEGEESSYYLVHGLSVAMEKMKENVKV